MSLLSGIELLRTHFYQRDILQEQRQVSKNPIYWTNEHVREWLIDIDLKVSGEQHMPWSSHLCVCMYVCQQVHTVHTYNTPTCPNSTYSVHGTYTHRVGMYSTCNTYSTYSTHSTHRTHSTHSTHSTYNTYSTHNTDIMRVGLPLCLHTRQ